MDLPSPAGPGRAISQNRSRKTYHALIAAGFRLLEQREFESITIADIAGEAGYSVGALYARFKSKDEFLEAMVAEHLQEREVALGRLFGAATDGAPIGEAIGSVVNYYWQRRGFWRAVLMRSTSDPDFWKPIHDSGVSFIERLTASIEKDAGRPLTAAEQANISFAVHMVLSMINNRIVNRPRPSLINPESFVPDLIRAFRLVSGYDRL